ncbi:MAG: DUF4143 domain-containing protein [Bacteroidales bacterium]|nr:DUF4143 domain-containing protein [Bacteroidales bacterium]
MIFAKFKKRVPVSRLKEVFQYAVFQAGKKFNASKASDSSNHARSKRLLTCWRWPDWCIVQHTAANGIPLGAEVNPKNFKIILFDHGIFQRILGLELSSYLTETDFTSVNKGTLAEQYVGTEIIKNHARNSRPQLYYWHREKRAAVPRWIISFKRIIKNSQLKGKLEGKMQGLRLFLQEKRSGGRHAFSFGKLWQSTYPGTPLLMR